MWHWHPTLTQSLGTHVSDSVPGWVVVKMCLCWQMSCTFLMPLQKYPLDEQECIIEMSSFRHKTHEYYLAWMEHPIGVGQSNLESFNLVGQKTENCTLKFSGGTYTCTRIVFHFNRGLAYFFLQVCWMDFKLSVPSLHYHNCYHSWCFTLCVLLWFRCTYQVSSQSYCPGSHSGLRWTLETGWTNLPLTFQKKKADLDFPHLKTSQLLSESQTEWKRWEKVRCSLKSVFMYILSDWIGIVTCPDSDNTEFWSPAKHATSFLY